MFFSFHETFSSWNLNSWALKYSYSMKEFGGSYKINFLSWSLFLTQNQKKQRCLCHKAFNVVLGGATSYPNFKIIIAKCFFVSRWLKYDKRFLKIFFVKIMNTTLKYINTTISIFSNSIQVDSSVVSKSLCHHWLSPKYNFLLLIRSKTLFLYKETCSLSFIKLIGELLWMNKLVAES